MQPAKNAKSVRLNNSVAYAQREFDPEDPECHTKRRYITDHATGFSVYATHESWVNHCQVNYDRSDGKWYKMPRTISIPINVNGTEEMHQFPYNLDCVQFELRTKDKGIIKTQVCGRNQCLRLGCHPKYYETCLSYAGRRQTKEMREYFVNKRQRQEQALHNHKRDKDYQIMLKSKAPKRFA